MVRQVLAMLGTVALCGLAACSTIPISEEDVFQNKPTVYPADLEARAMVDTLSFQNLFLPAAGDSVQLNAWLLRQPAARGTVLFFGGNGFALVNSRAYIDFFLGSGFDLLLVDYRGYGKSGGTPAVAALKADALVLYDYLVGEAGAAPDRVLVHGHSMGTFLALHVGTERETAGVVLENPLTTPAAWTDHLVPWFLAPVVSLELPEALDGEDNLARLRRLEEPVLIAAGAEDNVTSPAMARELAEAAEPDQATLLVIEGEGHNGLFRTDVFAAAYHSFLAEILTV